MKICILTKKEKPGVEKAILFTESFIDDCDVYCGEVFESLKDKVNLFTFISSQAIN